MFDTRGKLLIDKQQPVMRITGFNNARIIGTKKKHTNAQAPYFKQAFSLSESI